MWLALVVTFKIVSAEPLENNLSNGSINSGLLTVNGPDYIMSVQLNNGDEDSFNVVLDEGSSALTYTVPWGELFSLSVFDPTSIDIGF